MKKKKKINNDDPSINFRLSEELKKWVAEQAENQNRTVSNYLRDHLEEFMNGDLYGYKEDFKNSTEFIKLIIWMYSKRDEKNCTTTMNQLDNYIRTLKKIGEEFPDYLEVEFDKVLFDVIRVRNEKPEYYKEFIFSNKSNTQTGFDYNKLENHLLIKDYSNIIIREV